MKEMRHVMLFLSSPALAKALDKQYCLQHPKIWFGREACIRKDLWP
jgi:hypothetical protein